MIHRMLPDKTPHHALVTHRQFIVIFTRTADEPQQCAITVVSVTIIVLLASQVFSAWAVLV